MQDTLARTQLHTGATSEFRLASGYDQHTGRLPAVVIVHGWQSNVYSSSYTMVAETLNNLGYHTLQLSLRGHQDSKGDIDTVSRYDHVQDISAAFKYLTERPEVDMRRLGVSGTSYGAYLLARMAPQLASVKLMALRAPALYPDGDWTAPTKTLVDDPNRTKWRQSVHTAVDCSAMEGISEFKGVLLIVWSEQDEDMPVQVLQSYRGSARANTAEYLLRGAKHSLNDDERAEYVRMLSAFFEANYPKS